MSLAAFLAFVEVHGAAVVPVRRLEAVAPADVRAALHAAGVIVRAAPAATWRCDVRGCAREIHANYDGARLPLVAVCTQAPPACAPVELGFDDVGQQELSVEALVRAACALLGAAVDARALGEAVAPYPLGEARTPKVVARDAERDVYWIGAPRDRDLASLCARRERVARRTCVLVPTARHVPLEVAARYGDGEQVEVLALDGALAVEDGRLVLARTERASPPRASDAPEKSERREEGGGLAAVLGVTRWEAVRLTNVGTDTLKIEANGKTLLRTFVELGYADRRKPGVVQPVRGWHVLLLVCHNGGMLPSEYEKFGNAWAATKAMQRMVDPLREAFGLKASPMKRYSKKLGWIPRFRVGPAQG